MRKLFVQSVLFFFAIFLNFGAAYAQHFQWAKGGGTTADLSSEPSHTWEQTRYMCTDANGNIYALSQVGNNLVSADTFHEAPYGGFGTSVNILVTSYNCNGEMRWAKLISTTTGDCTLYGIAADSLGHIYVAGNFLGDASGGTLHIGYDTIIHATASQYFEIGLIQLDTIGHFNWIRYVGPGTPTAAMCFLGATNPIAMDGANNTHYFCYMKTGVALMPSVTSVYGVYDLTYDPVGNLTSAVRLDLDSEWWLHGAAIDPATNKLYVYGEGGIGVDSFFAAAYDTGRHSLWWYGLPHSGGLTGIALDRDKYLHFSGAANGGPFIFRDTTVSNTHLGGHDIAIIMTTDTNGNLRWVRHYDGNIYTSFSSIAVLPSKKIAAYGDFVGEVISIEGVNVVTPAGDGYGPYLVIVDSAGDLQTMQQLYGISDNNSGNVVVSDRVGNIYLGGQVEDSIWSGLPAIPAYHTVGGNSDFYVVKYGVDCSCTSMPVASYSDTGTHTFGFTYTGTTSGLDSVVWNYGDGATDTGISALHTYTTTGTYNACVTVYTNCGNDSVCHTLTVGTTGISPLSAFNVQVYPNPVNDELHIVGVPENTRYRLLNITGECVMRGSLKAGTTTISTHALSAGVYILEMTGAEGFRNIVRVVKE